MKRSVKIATKTVSCSCVGVCRCNLSFAGLIQQLRHDFWFGVREGLEGGRGEVGEYDNPLYVHMPAI